MCYRMCTDDVMWLVFAGIIVIISINVALLMTVIIIVPLVVICIF